MESFHRHVENIFGKDYAFIHDEVYVWKGDCHASKQSIVEKANAIWEYSQMHDSRKLTEHLWALADEMLQENDNEW